MEKKAMQGDERRKIRFIEKKFQTQFIVRFCEIVLLGGLLSTGILYFFVSRSTTVSIVNSRVVVQTTAEFLLPLLLQTMTLTVIAIAVAAIFLTLYASHKIAGPLYNLKRTMQRLKNGDFSTGFHIRHLDQLQDVANSVDEMIGGVRQDMKALKEQAERIKDGLDNISPAQVSPDKKDLLSDCQKTASELKKTLSHFKA